MEKAQTLNSIFGPVMITYLLTFADCGVTACGDEFANVDDARDVAFEISAECNRRINVIECFGASEHLIESVLA